MPFNLRSSPLPDRFHPWRRRALALMVVAVACAGALAEKADRTRPMVVEADKPGSVDLQRQVVVFAGKVQIVQGSMQIRAERVELRETPQGYRSGVAEGAPGVPASYRQKREGVDEQVEGSAERIEFDGRTEVLRFVGNAVVRRLRAREVVDEITGALIAWDHAAETFSVQGGAPSPGNPDGRVRAVLGPRADRASAPASRVSGNAR
ncbi:MAG TPA: lipopolysaccharide transport periplasmic protein LptA [Rubrivivax sp.]|nr:lipopolysaccharide transport periplasmic protein LptA [Rubrivivax sp.]